MQTFKEFYKIEEDVLEEGGQAGHMQAPFEDPNMTIGDLKSLVNDLFDGKIEVTEKLDGQNIAVTWKNGRLGAARNKSTTRDPMTIEDVAKKFAGRGEIEAAFVNSMKDLESAFSKISEDERQRIFNGGQNFLNLEIIYPPSKNVLDYGNKAMLVFHGISIFDLITAKKVGDDPKLAADALKYLEREGALNQETFEIAGPIPLKLKDNDFSDIKKKHLASIKKLGRKDSDTIEDFLEDQWSDWLSVNTSFPEEVNELLVNRYVRGIKQPSLTQIKKMIDKDQHSELKSVDSQSGELHKQFIAPIATIVLMTGNDYLRQLSGLMTVDPKETISSMAKDVMQAVKYVDSKKNEPDQAAIKMAASLDKINLLGGVDQLAATEGVVFKRNDKIYKLTGLFAPVNQLLGVLKFGI